MGDPEASHRNAVHHHRGVLRALPFIEQSSEEE